MNLLIGTLLGDEDTIHNSKTLITIYVHFVHYSTHALIEELDAKQVHIMERHRQQKRL